MTSELLTAEELAAELRVSYQGLLRWRREGRIKAEVMLGQYPRFSLRKVKNQLADYQAKRYRAKFNGMVPTL